MTTEQEKRINQLLDKYLAGTSTPEENQLVDEWYNSLAMVEDIRLQQPAFMAAAEQQLRAGLPDLPASISNQRAVIRRLYRWTAAAAAMVAGIVLSWAGYRWYNVHAHRTNMATAMHTHRRELKKLVLPDGSTVWMNEFSTLEWNTDFNKNSRVVKLNGEARFDIAPQAGKPFRVQVGNTVTTVLGTVFNVEGYEQEQSIKVALLSGKVRFEKDSSNNKPVVLTPGSMVTYNRLSGNSLVTSTGSTAVDAWMDGAIVFNEVPVEEALRRLARHFDWTIKWQHPLPVDGTTVTALFRRETPEQILQGIALTNQVKYTLKDKQLTILGTD
ncbi:FecR family protein [Filimonas lacunae]|uniref:FecR family protein n=1 Tax=Filimonas lacunae TaxID=477680 RepID=A0A173MEK8_9BACT|nr:FecR domain-containing protein [Filimonas lacunae]BAV06005.1 anti-sigma factor [Filimonas lacunae]SIT24147.1 FecR family protein [Filimonas lacunae]